MGSITTAILLDFDNVFSSLEKISKSAAKKLHGSTQAWLQWFRDGEHDAASDAAKRRIVVQRCYLNPAAFGKYRQSFTRGGFEVVDCPALTSSAKNSADINMVMDVIDLLRHSTRIEEFVILSADADFTPVLHRIRLHDRIATIYANDVTAAALRNSASIMIDQDRFVEEALGADQVASKLRPSNGAVGHRIADPGKEISLVASILARALSQRGQVQSNEVGGIIKAEYPPFGQSNDWLGFGTLNPLLDKIAETDPRIVITGEMGAAKLELRGSNLTPDAQAVIDYMREMVMGSPSPVNAARVGSSVNRKFAGLKEGGWFGFGSMSDLIIAANLPDLKLLNVDPGYIMNPQIHSAEMIQEIETQAPENLKDLPQPLIEFITFMNEQTGWPRLSPQQINDIAELGAEAVRAGFADRNSLGKEIRDRFDARVALGELEARYSVSRTAVNFILTSIIHAGHEFGAECTTSDSFRRSAFDGFVTLYETRVGPLSADNKTTTATHLFGFEYDSKNDLADDPEGPNDVGAPSAPELDEFQTKYS